MFSNIGEKIKKLSKIVCWIGMIGCVIVGIIMLLLTDEREFWDRKDELIISGIVWIVVGPLASWIGSFLLYGFGELISSQKNSEKYLEQLCHDQQDHNHWLTAQPRENQVSNNSVSAQLRNGLNSNKGTAEQLCGDPISENDIPVETIICGIYPQTKGGTDNTPIEWIILERKDDKALVISKYALDAMAYNTDASSATWENCFLRKWLNNDFYNRAFSVDEKKNIVRGKVTADKNPEYDTNPGSDTTDNIFLLSISEANKYFIDDVSRMCTSTDYAVKNGAYTNFGHMVAGRACCWWWLRSPGGAGDSVANVHDDGSVGNCGGSVKYKNRSVRPCMWVRLS